MAVLGDATATAKNMSDIDRLPKTIRQNLERIIQHGKRADSIVKSMLLHSRSGSGDHRQVEINSLLDETLNLTFHGARVQRPDFSKKLVRELDERAGRVDL